MNRDLRLAVASDYPAICAYLEAHWRKGHVFTKSRALFDWQHRNGDDYNFVLGCASDGSIHGVLGFIPHGQYGPSLQFESLWLCIWSVCEEARGHGLGRLMLDYLEAQFNPVFIGTNGASDMTLPMYQARGWTTGKLEHWYFSGPCAACDEDGHAVVEPALPSFFGDFPWGERPWKTPTYLLQRYTHHPFYRYDFYAVKNSSAVGFAVTRICEGGTERDPVRSLRIVDYIGDIDAMRGTAEAWEQVQRDTQCGIIDFYCSHLDKDIMHGAGFSIRDADEVIIPNHFEPYEHRNVDINYAVKAPKGMPWRVVKGDGDQDRPNLLGAP